MPQIRFECSPALLARIDVRGLFADIHAALVDLADSSLADCKSRVVPVENVHIADGAPELAMAHVEIRLLAGRTEDAKRALGERVLAALRARCENVAGYETQTTVEIVDMPRERYFKAVIDRRSA